MQYKRSSCNRKLTFLTGNPHQIGSRQEMHLQFRMKKQAKQGAILNLCFDKISYRLHFLVIRHQSFLQNKVKRLRLQCTLRFNTLPRVAVSNNPFYVPFLRPIFSIVRSFFSNSSIFRCISQYFVEPITQVRFKPQHAKNMPNRTKDIHPEIV